MFKPDVVDDIQKSSSIKCQDKNSYKEKIVEQLNKRTARNKVLKRKSPVFFTSSDLTTYNDTTSSRRFEWWKHSPNNNSTVIAQNENVVSATVSPIRLCKRKGSTGTVDWALLSKADLELNASKIKLSKVSTTDKNKNNKTDNLKSNVNQMVENKSSRHALKEKCNVILPPEYFVNSHSTPSNNEIRTEFQIAKIDKTIPLEIPKSKEDNEFQVSRTSSNPSLSTSNHLCDFSSGLLESPMQCSPRKKSRTDRDSGNRSIDNLDLCTNNAIKCSESSRRECKNNISVHTVVGKFSTKQMYPLDHIDILKHETNETCEWNGFSFVKPNGPRHSDEPPFVDIPNDNIKQSHTNLNVDKPSKVFTDSTNIPNSNINSNLSESFADPACEPLDDRLSTDCDSESLQDPVDPSDFSKHSGGLLYRNLNLDSTFQDSTNISTGNSEQSYFEQSENETCSGNFDLYEFDSRHSLLTLDVNTRVYFYGLITVQVLKGTVEILGYSLKPSKIIEAYSPRGSSLLYFDTASSKLDTSEKVNVTLPADINLPENIIDKINKLQPGGAALLCTKLELPKISFLEKYIPQHIFPKTEGSIDCVFNLAFTGWNGLRANEYWTTLAKNFNEESRLLICGGKSVGKSFLLRYLINKTLGKYRRMLVIDLDPGQPEFTVAGCISATIVEAPVFGPNYTHLRKPNRCLFISEVNIGIFYISYIKAVKDLMESCKYDDMPTVINCMGYTRGSGFNLLAATIAIIKPTSVVEIQSNSKARNYPKDIHHSNIFTAASQLLPEIDSIPFFTHTTIKSMADDNRGWHLEPRQIREMSVLCYFGVLLHNCDDSLTHRNVPIYEINLSSITFMRNNEIVDPAATNANLVALCSLNSLTNSTTYICHGWGIVRAIDLELNVCYLITPLSSEELEQIDYFILGAVNLPPSIYMVAHNCSDLVPYVARNILPHHGAIPKRSHLSQRSLNR